MRFGMAIDLDKCTGCRACVIACKSENNIPVSTYKDVEENRVIEWLEIIPVIIEEGETFRLRIIPRPCLMCENPPCIKVCPVSATYKGDYGLIGQIYRRCIGCRYCMNNCPYNVKKFNWYKPKWVEEFKNTINPDVSVRPKGVVEKCTFCYHRLQIAKEKAKSENRQLREGDFVPACVEVCPADAMVFGDIDNPGSIISQWIKSPRVFRLLEDMGTEPKVFHLYEEKLE